MFRVKICGVTSEADVDAAIEAGADAIGLNFYEKSPRSIAASTAQELASKIGPRALAVGVFVNASAERINETVATAGLDAIQLHGDEPAELVADLVAGTPVVRAYRYGAEGIGPLVAWLEQAEAHGRPASAVLIDAWNDRGAYGGTGERVDADRLVAERSAVGATPLVLAGGLRPENVAEAIRAVRPDGVDTASGVERDPGRKDADRVREFVSAAMQAFTATS